MIAAAAGLAAVAAALLLGARVGEPLWYDELQSLTFAAQPLGRLVGAVREFDLHPPLYYALLGVWLRLGESTEWIRLSGVLAYAGVGVGVWLGTGAGTPPRLRSRALATATAVAAPAALAYATEVRMYPLMMGLAALAWGVGARPGGRARTLALASCLVALAWSHATGALAVLAVAAAAMVTASSPGRWWRSVAERIRGASDELGQGPRTGGPHARPDTGPPLAPLVAVAALAVLSVAPWLVGSHGSGAHLDGTGVSAMVRDLGLLLTGFAALPRAAGPAALLALGLALALGRDATRLWTAAALLVLPALVFAVGSALVAPVWHGRAMLFGVPIVFAVASLALSESRVRLLRVLGPPLLLACVIALSLQQRGDYRRQVSIETAIAEILERGGPDDAVLIPNARLFWGWAWFAGAPADPFAGQDSYVAAVGDLPQAGVSPHTMRPVPAHGTVWLLTKSSDAAERRLAADPAWERVTTIDRLSLWRERRPGTR